jgi:hypothetical protein
MPSQPTNNNPRPLDHARGLSVLSIRKQSCVKLASNSPALIAPQAVTHPDRRRITNFGSLSEVLGSFSLGAVFIK